MSGLVTAVCALSMSGLLVTLPDAGWMESFLRLLLLFHVAVPNLKCGIQRGKPN